MSQKFLYFGLVLCCCWVTLTGCQKNSNGTVPVTVQINYNGKPLDEAVVVFRGETPANGATDANGFTRLSSFTRNDGAKPGSYQVTVEKATMKETKDAQGDKVIKSETTFHVPAVYGVPDKSGLTAEVSAQGKNHFVFELDDSRKNEKVVNPNAIKR